MERYIACGDDSLTLRLVSKLPDLRVANAKWIRTTSCPSRIEWGSINMMHAVASYQRDSKWGRLRALPAADKASKKEWQRSKFDERTRVTNFGYRNRT